MIVYREIEAVADLEQIVDLETLVWQMAEREAVPVNILHAITHSGGCVIGAYDAEKLMGFALAILARDNHEIYLWSHMAAVHPAYQSQGIGFQLKQQQRQWGLDRGYQTMRWTFDPLMRRNAHFNLYRLGACANVYHINFYGKMRDGLNAGMESDRLEITWRLNDSRVIAHAQQQFMPVKLPIEGDFLLKVEPSGELCIGDTTRLESPVYWVEIPEDITHLKRTNHALAVAWQQGLRVVLQGAFSQGYYIVDFGKKNEKYGYVLYR